MRHLAPLGALLKDFSRDWGVKKRLAVGLLNRPNMAQEAALRLPSRF